jgi:hypothetical protein
MGFLSFYIGYRKGKRSERRRAECEEWGTTDFYDNDEICDNCGCYARQHSEQGECPRYDGCIRLSI